MKHVAIDLKLKKRTLLVSHIPAAQQRADTLTKALQPKEYDLQLVNLVSHPSLD